MGVLLELLRSSFRKEEDWVAAAVMQDVSVESIEHASFPCHAAARPYGRAQDQGLANGLDKAKQHQARLMAQAAGAVTKLMANAL